mmetsp:Transcript_61144/g.161736  ORF Transcript_61144/g.161736 Transcript_61144/m.161736 type:complete len:204 (-) Transcript_61144:2947-3558(-)
MQLGTILRLLLRHRLRPDLRVHHLGQHVDWPRRARAVQRRLHLRRQPGPDAVLRAVDQAREQGLPAVVLHLRPHRRRLRHRLLDLGRSAARRLRLLAVPHGRRSLDDPRWRRHQRRAQLGADAAARLLPGAAGRQLPRRGARVARRHVGRDGDPRADAGGGQLPLPQAVRARADVPRRAEGGGARLPRRPHPGHVRNGHGSQR